jgi:hypothetical protein
MRATCRQDPIHAAWRSSDRESMRATCRQDPILNRVGRESVRAAVPEQPDSRGTSTSTI